MSSNNVRGPTSALTEFLRASGITPTTVARRAATRQQQQQQPIAGPSGTQADDVDQQEEHDDAGDAEEEAASPRRRTRAGRAAAAAAANYDSDQLDEPEEATPAPKKRKLTKAAEAKLKAKEKVKAKKGKKGDDGGDDDDYEEEEGEDAYKALSKMWSGGDARPPVGSFEDCPKCEKQFTVTKYTMAAVPGPGFLCHQCAKASGSDPFKKPAAPKRKKISPVDKRNVVYFEEKRFPTLVLMCIQLITKHIDDVEALGDIGSVNMDAISKALSKNRSLTPENAQLFYTSTNTTLTFYDATNLTSAALTTLFHLNPALTTLHLDFCGHLDDPAMHTLSSSLPALTSLTLLGPFLVRPPAWQAFFRAHPRLSAFRIIQSPRFNTDCIQELVKHSAPTLKALQLREVGLLNEAFLLEIGKLRSGTLQELDLSDPGQQCSEDSLIELLAHVGGGLKVLNLSRHHDLSDTFLSEGLAAHVRSLTSLTLSYLPLLTTAGLVSLFSTWQNPPLVRLSLARNPALGGDALVGIMKHSGKRLEELNVNGWGEVDQAALRAVGKWGTELKRVDVGWCREVDDFVVKEWMEGVEGPGARLKVQGCRRLKEVKVWGCNKITARCPSKPGINIHGIESHAML